MVADPVCAIVCGTCMAQENDTAAVMEINRRAIENISN
jgi:hypothetical protein